MSICDVCPLKGLPEVWAPVTVPTSHRYGHTYEVSTHGRVRNRTTLRLLKLQAHATGYQIVNLGRAARALYVHRLVLAAFVGPPPFHSSGMEGDHLDFDRHHNVVHNLRWLAKDTNAWRWKFWADADPEPEQPPPTAEEVAEDERRRVAMGWPPPRPRKPWEHHRHDNRERESA